jgi:hypothetical protein
VGSWLTSLLTWLLVHTIYGVLAVAGLLYVALREAKRRFPRFPEPLYIVGPLFLIGVVVVPSIPRYQFEKQTLAQIEGKGWIRVVNQTRIGDVLEPLTWVKTPVGSVTIIMPEPPTEDQFRLVVMQYGKEPRVSMADPDCARSKIIYAEPGKDRVFRYTTQSPVQMSPVERSWFCDYDWTREKEAFRTEYLRPKGK